MIFWRFGAYLPASRNLSSGKGHAVKPKSKKLHTADALIAVAVMAGLGVIAAAAALAMLAVALCT